MRSVEHFARLCDQDRIAQIHVEDVIGTWGNSADGRFLAAHQTTASRTVKLSIVILIVEIPSAADQIVDILQKGVGADPRQQMPCVREQSKCSNL
jgi:hypothetical protein